MMMMMMMMILCPKAGSLTFTPPEDEISEWLPSSQTITGEQ